VQQGDKCTSITIEELLENVIFLGPARGYITRITGQLELEFKELQLADDEGVQGVQLRVQSPAVKRKLYMCCSTAIFGVRNTV
jgi:hypothetical protein